MISWIAALILGGLAGIGVGILAGWVYFSTRARSELAQLYNDNLKPAYEKALAKQEVMRIAKSELDGEAYHARLIDFGEAASIYNALIERMHKSRVLCDYGLIKRQIRKGRLSARIDYGAARTELVTLDQTEEPLTDENAKAQAETPERPKGRKRRER